jgi:phage shock protein PspC (stress-responsive transcriptional regulator)
VNRRLYRSRTDTVLGGVAAGLADYLGADPALVRVAWALLVVITGGAALLAYIVAWIVVPEEPATPAAAATEPITDPATGEVITTQEAEPAATAASAQRSSANAGVLVGIGLVLIGAWFLVREYLPEVDWGLIWPVVLVAVGALILFTSMRRREG